MRNKSGFVLYFTFCMLLMMSTTAHAYIDPSAMTYMIQAIAGIAIAIGAAFAIVWRRFKKKAAQKLGIDENAHKEMEEEVVFSKKKDA